MDLTILLIDNGYRNLPVSRINIENHGCAANSHHRDRRLVLHVASFGNLPSNEIAGVTPPAAKVIGHVVKMIVSAGCVRNGVLSGFFRICACAPSMRQALAVDDEVAGMDVGDGHVLQQQAVMAVERDQRVAA